MEKALLFARNNLLSYAIAQNPSYVPAEHHRKIARALERISSGDCKRLIITMPPRHGKSMLISEYFPAWFLGNHPDKYVIFAAYAQEFADDFGRKVRNQLQDPLFKAIFPECQISADSASASKFNTVQKGSYFAVGVGGPIVGRGAHLAIIDDPVKSREEIESDLFRRKQKDWYQSVMRTRLMPGGAIVIVHCMTGDTPVLMGDATEKFLRNIKIGDVVATYNEGVLSQSVVKNHRSNGNDKIFTITTKSGKIVRANERHPFLVNDNGDLKWIKVKNLNTEHYLVKVNGENGKVKPVLKKDATIQQNAGDIVCRITTRKNGLMAAALHLLSKIRHRVLVPSLNIVTESLLTITSKFLPNKTAYAQFVNEKRVNQGILSTGMTSCVSITATEPERYVGYSVTTATLPSVEAKHQKFSKPLQTTSDFIQDKIISIEESGIEEVFDLQIEGTENFIANGLVSHNTRWHEDDLIGWVLGAHQHEKWEVIDLPAISEDGKALWPEMYPIPELEILKDTLGMREWNSQFMQNPVPESGDFFKREWFQFYDVPPTGMYIYGASDFAVTDKGGDFTEHGIFGIDDKNNIYILDWWSGQTNSAEWINSMLDLHDQWKTMNWYGEAGVIRRAVEPQLAKRMEERKLYLNIEWMASMADKSARASNFQGRAANRKVFLPRKAHWASDLLSQLIRFPAGLHDDKVDVCSLIGRGLQSQSAPTNTSVSSMDAYREKKHSRGSAWTA